MTTVGAIFDIKKYAIHDGPGIRTTVFFMGCPLDCWWCHNPECRLNGNAAHNPLGKSVGYETTVGKIMDEIRKDIIFYDQSGGGMTVSGGEPMMQADFLRLLLQACRTEGIRTAVDTSGYAPWDEFEKIHDLTDLFLYDLKLIDDTAHRKYTDVSNQLILENLVRLTKAGSRVNLRVPLIPGITDTAENLDAILDTVAPLKNIREISLLPYNLLAGHKFRKYNIPDRMGKIESQPPGELEKMGARFSARGYRVKIGG